jgi:hypothetical protein
MCKHTLKDAAHSPAQKHAKQRQNSSARRCNAVDRLTPQTTELQAYGGYASQQ